MIRAVSGECALSELPGQIAKCHVEQEVSSIILLFFALYSLKPGNSRFDQKSEVLYYYFICFQAYNEPVLLLSKIQECF